MIKIHYDFTDGTEVSYIEGLKLKDNFTTNCLDFFCFDTDVDDVEVVSKNGDTLSRNSLLRPNEYTNKEMVKAHNIHKMLKAGAFKWIEPLTKVDAKSTSNLTSHGLADNELYELCFPEKLVFRYNYIYGEVDFSMISLRDYPIEIILSKIKPDEMITFSLNPGDDTNVEQVKGSIFWNHDMYGKCIRIKSNENSIVEWLDEPAPYREK